MVLLCINSVFRKLYSSGVWLPQDVALEVGRQGMTALRGYAKLAKSSMEMNEPQYPLYPKFIKVSHVIAPILVAHLAECKVRMGRKPYVRFMPNVRGLHWPHQQVQSESEPTQHSGSHNRLVSSFAMAPLAGQPMIAQLLNILILAK